MKGKPTTAVLALATMLAVVAVADGEGVPSRTEYVAQVDPICKANTDSNKRILDGAAEKVNKGKLAAAGRQFTRAAQAFGKSVQEIMAIPRPPEDNARLEKWFKFLKIIQEKLGKVGKALKEGDKVKAVHEKIRAERS